MGVPANVLRGAKDSKKEWLERLPTFGKGKHRTAKYWSALGHSLVAESLIGGRVCGGNFGKRGTYTAFSVTDAGKAFLANSKVTLKIIPTKELRSEKRSGERPKPAPLPANILPAAVEPSAAELVARLRDLRGRLSVEMNLAPHMIFSDETLDKLASIRPASRVSLTRMGLEAEKMGRFGGRVSYVLPSRLNKCH